MKHLLIVCDGMADEPLPELGGLTPLQHVPTPHLDWLARHGRNGLLQTIPPGLPPGTEVAHSVILGYGDALATLARGPLEAASLGVELDETDLALRCNFVTVDRHRLLSHTAGRIPSAASLPLIRFLQERLGGPRVRFVPADGFRHLLVLRQARGLVGCTPPHDFLGEPFLPRLPRALSPEAEPTVRRLRALMRQSHRLLAAHPLNIERHSRGLLPANAIWPWGAGRPLRLEPLAARYPRLRSGAVVAAASVVRGLGRCAGLSVVDVSGATGLPDTDYEAKARAALRALREHDFVLLHIDAPDEASHDGNLALKLQTIDHIDRRLLRPILGELQGWREPVALALLPDHPTPVRRRFHTSQPVPFVILSPRHEPDDVGSFSEEAARRGAYGVLPGARFMTELLEPSRV